MSSQALNINDVTAVKQFQHDLAVELLKDSIGREGFEKLEVGLIGHLVGALKKGQTPYESYLPLLGVYREAILAGAQQPEGIDRHRSVVEFIDPMEDQLVEMVDTYREAKDEHNLTFTEIELQILDSATAYLVGEDDIKKALTVLLAYTVAYRRFLLQVRETIPQLTIQ